MSLTQMSHTVRDQIILRLGNGIELFDSIDCCDQDSSFADERRADRPCCLQHVRRTTQTFRPERRIASSVAVPAQCRAGVTSWVGSSGVSDFVGPILLVAIAKVSRNLPLLAESSRSAERPLTTRSRPLEIPNI